MKSAFSSFLFTCVLLCAGAGFAQETAPNVSAPPAEEQYLLSEAERKELLASVDEILAFVSKNTGLAIKHPVKREIANRAQFRKYVLARLEKEKDDVELQERGQVVMKKLGLLPRDFDLRAFLVDILEEQVAGYYDFDTDTVYLLDWVKVDEQKPVLAHELMHALQDQNYDINKFIEVKDAVDYSKPELLKALKKPMTFDAKESRAARQAMLEGQGTIVMIDYILSPANRTVLEVPMILEAMREGVKQAPEKPVLKSAPMVIREALQFPYITGMEFVYQVLKAGGAKLAYQDILQRPPVNSREIMRPKSYLEDEKIPPIQTASLGKALGREYGAFDVDTLGQFDVHLLMKQWHDDAATSIADAWRGSFYVTALDCKQNDCKQLKGKTPVESAKMDPARLSLFYVSRWADAASAKRFAELYASALPKRYQQAKQVEGSSTRWSTEHGDVNIEVSGDMVFVTEGFAQKTADKLRRTVVSTVAPTSARK